MNPRLGLSSPRARILGHQQADRGYYKREQARDVEWSARRTGTQELSHPAAHLGQLLRVRRRGRVHRLTFALAHNIGPLLNWEPQTACSRVFLKGGEMT